MHDFLMLDAVQSPLAVRDVVVVCQEGERVEEKASPLWLLSILVRRAAAELGTEQIFLILPDFSSKAVSQLFSILTLDWADTGLVPFNSEVRSLIETIGLDIGEVEGIQVDTEVEGFPVDAEDEGILVDTEVEVDTEVGGIQVDAENQNDSNMLYKEYFTKSVKKSLFNNKKLDISEVPFHNFIEIEENNTETSEPLNGNLNMKAKITQETNEVDSYSADFSKEQGDTMIKNAIQCKFCLKSLRNERFLKRHIATAHFYNVFGRKITEFFDNERCKKCQTIVRNSRYRHLMKIGHMPRDLQKKLDILVEEHNGKNAKQR